jgi:hypothetical protein
LSNFYTSTHTFWFTESTTHTGLKSIGTGTGKHFVDTEDVVRVASDAHVKSFFATGFGQIFVGLDTGSFKSVGGDLFSFTGT